ncbi:hypothetical protein [Vibrio cincinnatiensis]|uniref:hypothetical protein n=1 Tax=Vibrio cincinnatiensis TaxID=675 RepID=UPI001EE10522|nr:hypothetical protein [Vibrio cincinnatiensis]
MKKDVISSFCEDIAHFYQPTVFLKKTHFFPKAFFLYAVKRITLRELLGFPRRRKPEISENQLEKSPWQ